MGHAEEGKRNALQALRGQAVNWASEPQEREVTRCQLPGAYSADLGVGPRSIAQLADPESASAACFEPSGALRM